MSTMTDRRRCHSKKKVVDPLYSKTVRSGSDLKWTCEYNIVYRIVYVGTDTSNAYLYLSDYNFGPVKTWYALVDETGYFTYSNDTMNTTMYITSRNGYSAWVRIYNNSDFS